MGKISLLPDILAHKIAAGEVVERPASVVKELLENALDSEARRIMVKAEQGGKRLISVCDDGVGMSGEDARLAFQHHATSKIHSFEDLTQLQTLGFRGEALPSIASVSRLRLRTVERAVAQGNPLGTEIESEGGAFKAVREISWPSGTEVVVEDLFFNVPARRKFLKTTTTELTHLSRQIMHYAVAYPQVEFQFRHQQRTVLEAASVTKLEDRIYQVLGDSFLENLIPVAYEKNGVRVSGFTSLPHEQRSNSTSLFLYVNRRMVRDRVLTHAIRLAYQDQVPSSAYPVVILFVEVDPRQVDVNVHPCKTEIRFTDPNSVHSTLFHGIEEALLTHRSSLSHLARDISSHHLQALNRPHPQMGPGKGINTFFARHSQKGRDFPALHQNLPTDFSPSLSGHASAQHITTERFVNGDAHQDDIPQTDYIDPLPILLGQFVESFVVSADREGVMLVDQHVAHERILYDQALRQLDRAGACPTQRLLIPLTHELNMQQKSVFEKISHELNDNGFEVECFGGQTIAIKGVPALARDCDAILLVQEILDSFDSTQDLESRENRLQRLREKIAISLSCRAAIKINTPLSREKMQWLLDQLFQCDNPFTCPHGRPIVLRVGIEEILRGFKRI
ncbi:DNA mismatch repair endonuclease MutL [Acidobacteria bacterium AH-259-D05]|nr:DNA mismatch repair endonuclease MutL [Acidobacteria bacterium AH-259-D05]